MKNQAQKIFVLRGTTAAFYNTVPVNVSIIHSLKLLSIFKNISKICLHACFRSFS
jgi:hypothetical protein